jgi:hypothetical protein
MHINGRVVSGFMESISESYRIVPGGKYQCLLII